MSNGKKFYLLFLVFTSTILGIGFWVGDPMYPVRMVQSGSHEGLFVLLGLVLGLTMRSRTDEDSIWAVLCAICMAVISFLVGGLDIDDKGVVNVGLFLSVLFLGSMLGTLVFLVRALRNRVREGSGTEDQSTS